MNPSYLKDTVPGNTKTDTIKYALLNANEVVMMLPEFRTVLADLKEKWQTVNQFPYCDLQ